MSNPSPAKKRKRNEPKIPSRTIKSFFEKSNSRTQPPRSLASSQQGHGHNTLTDEELARKLQAEWNEEVREVHQENDPRSDSVSYQLRPASDKVEPPEAGTSVKSEQNDQYAPEKTNHVGVLGLQTATSVEDTISSAIPFDQSPLEFEPSVYIGQLKKHWEAHDGSASYALLTRAFVLVNNTQSRIKIVDTLVNLLRTLIEGDPASLLPSVWLATNAFAPPYIPLELGLGGSAISKALKNAYGLDNSSLKALYNKHGDAGDVAFEAKKRQAFTLSRPKPLTVKGVYGALMKIANSKGTGSQELKQRIVEKLLQDTRGPEEGRYIVRTLVQHLRIGAVKTTMLKALARAFLYSKPPSAQFKIQPKSELKKLKKEELANLYARAEEIVKASYARHPNYNDLVPCLLESGVSEDLLQKCGLTLHIPLMPMLGSITRDLTEMLTKLQGRDFTCEYKYDGQRAQVHCDISGKVSIFSRHLESMTDKYPDLVSLVPHIKGDSVSSFILEGEVVAVAQDSGELLPFQTLTNRAKKNVEIGSIKINVCLFAFDLMYLNGEPLLNRSLRERRELLHSLFVEVPKRFTWVKSIDATSSDSEAVLNFFKDATNEKCEGIMVKVLDDKPNSVESNLQSDLASIPMPSLQTSMPETKGKTSRRRALLSTYEPDKRLESWLKVKKDYSASSDTLDLIPIGGWHGQGRKAKWWSPILLAVRDPDTGALQAVTKCMSGFTDKFYQENKEKYAEDSDNVISRPSYMEYRGEPDVWFEPQEVWEVAFADITLSPTYTAAMGLVSEERGLSLRFPRFLKVREDKGIEEASTSEFLASLWWKQMERSKTDQQANTPSQAELDDLENY
ncbi:hypothetical protein VTO42DRAFT_5366 [Malbranchea cinnamomea]